MQRAVIHARANERWPVMTLALCAAGVVGCALLAPPLFAAYGLPVALAAIVVAGLPHGTLDIKAIKDSQGLGPRGTLAMLGLYVVLAAAMGLLWVVAPGLALLAFLAIGAVHFADDWAVDGVPGLAAAVPLALFSAGAIRDRAPYDAIFGALARDHGGAAVTDLLIMISPVAHAAALAAGFAWVVHGEAGRALAAAICIGAMWSFTPVIGFAIYFVAYHSPIHVREVFGIVRGSRVRLGAEAMTTFAISTAAIVVLGDSLAASDGFSGIGSSVFIVLSVLTVPHMLVPPLVARALATRRRASQARR